MKGLAYYGAWFFAAWGLNQVFGLWGVFALACFLLGLLTGIWAALYAGKKKR